MLFRSTAVAIRLESKGPAFYRQRRVGLYNQGFDILKLRSMRQDAEVPGQAVWAEKDDPRITRIGRVIRKVRIDELPQAWSVLKGEMMKDAAIRKAREEVGVDLEEVAHETQWVNQRPTKELLLTLTVADPDGLRRRLATRLGAAGSSPVMAAAIVRSLSVFNSLEANPDALARSGYRFGLRLLPIDSPELVRTEVGKVPLLVDRIDDRSPGPRRSA